MNLIQRALNTRLGKGIVFSTALTTALLTNGCDTAREVELETREYDGPVTIELIQNVRTGDKDIYYFFVKDSTGNNIAYMMNVGKPTEIKIERDDGRVYSLDDKGIRNK